jgi:hypothetical protein
MGQVFVIAIARILETMFVVGTLGSVVVLILTGIEDLKMLLGREDENS